MSIDFRLARSFGFAFEGVKTALKEEPNLKIHFFLAFLAVLLALLLNFSASEWAILILTIGLVLVSELINTSLEAIVNLVSPEIREKARHAKDVAAAAVFISATVSILIASFLFLPKII
jgi:diacylglycerol kinase